jgi:hypothetical protein
MEFGLGCMEARVWDGIFGMAFAFSNPTSFIGSNHPVDVQDLLKHAVNLHKTEEAKSRKITVKT